LEKRCSISGRQDGLFELAGDGAIGREQLVLGQLLGDGAGALGRLAPDQVDGHGLDQAAEVDPDEAVLVEVAVLGGDGGVLQIGRDLVERDLDAIRATADVGHQLGAGAVEELDLAGVNLDIARVAAAGRPPR